MKSWTTVFYCISFLLFSMASGRAEPPSVVITGVWVRPSPVPGRPVGAYLDLTNPGETDNRLLAVRSPLASSVEMHRHTHKDGVMRMEKQDSVTLPARQTVVFQPGSYHLMLFGVQQKLVEGDHLSLTLHFTHGPSQTVIAPVMRHRPEQGISR